MVRRETLAERLLVVVRALHERLARHVVRHGLLRRVEELVVAAATGRVDEAARDAADQELVGDLQLDDVVKLLLALAEHLVELLGLRRRAREAIEDEALLARAVRLKLVLDHADHDLVLDKAALVHDLLRLLAEVRAERHLLAQQIARGEVAHHVLEALQDLGRLRALAGTGRADEHHAHAVVARSRCLAFQHGNLFVQLVDERLEVRKLGRGSRHDGEEEVWPRRASPIPGLMSALRHCLPATWDGHATVELSM